MSFFALLECWKENKKKKKKQKIAKKNVKQRKGASQKDKIRFYLSKFSNTFSSTSKLTSDGVRDWKILLLNWGSMRGVMNK